MAIICRKHRLLFVMTPRTACTAIGELLLKRYGGEYLPGEDILDPEGHVRIQKKHSTLPQLLTGRVITEAEAGGLLKFATVRNPFDSLVSLYLKQRSKYQPLLSDPDSWVNRSPAYARNMRYATTHSFSQWVFRKCRKQWLKRLVGSPPSMFHEFTSGVDVIMKYENIAEDLDAVLQRAGAKIEGEIPLTNRTTERTSADYRDSYSRATQTAVRFAFSEDFRRYGYSFDPATSCS